MAPDLTYRLHNPTVTFEVMAEGTRTKKGVWLVLRTKEGGDVGVWAPLKLISFCRYTLEGEPVKEVEVPKWWARKTGLI